MKAAATLCIKLDSKIQAQFHIMVWSTDSSWVQSKSKFQLQDIPESICFTKGTKSGLVTVIIV
jgi:hypothetical protein